jgi:chromosome partitioning protein
MMSEPSEPSERSERNGTKATTRVASIQQKGGVGKSTTTINVAGALADRVGRDNVLLIDTDPQAFTSNKLGFKKEYLTADPNLAEAMLDPTEHDVHDLIVEHSEFDVIPSHIDLFNFQKKILSSGWQPAQRLNRLLEDLEAEHEYEYIVIDAPPTINTLTDNVLRAVDNVLIPVELDDIMKLSLQQLLTHLNRIEKQHEHEITEVGIVISNSNHPLSNVDREMFEWFEETFSEEYPTYGNRDFRGRCPLFNVRNRKDISESLLGVPEDAPESARSSEPGGSIFEHRPECDQRETYEAIAAEIATAAKTHEVSS